MKMLPRKCTIYTTIADAKKSFAVIQLLLLLIANVE